MINAASSRRPGLNGPAPKRNLCQQVVDELGREIVGGEHRPGDTLPTEAALGARFGVSRSVLREAVKTLAAKGLIETRAKTGSRVRPPAEWNLLDLDVLDWRYATLPAGSFFRDLFEVRQAVEPAAAALAAAKAGAAEIAAIGRACAAMEAADPNADAAIAADIDFHRRILGACRNPLLAQLGMLIGVGLRASFRLSTRSYAVSLPGHRPVYEAIRSRDAAAARAAMERLLTRTLDFIEGDLKHHPYGRAK